MPSSETASRHKCMIYDGHPSEQLPVIVPLILDGLRERKRCLYLGDEPTVKMVQGALVKRGLDVTAEMARGALVFSSDRSHLDGGGFDPVAMVEMLCKLIDQALADGFSGLCATGDMRWELGEDVHFDRLLEYEARLEQVFKDKPLSGICQYHRATVPPRALQDALSAHRSAYIGQTLNTDNLFYIPPELILRGDKDEMGEWVWRQINRIQRAEAERDRSLKDLAELNQELEQRVKERTADLETFSYSVSHDLRTPLRSINGFCKIIMEDHGEAFDEEARAHFDRIVRSTVRMDQLIDAMLLFFNLSRREMVGDAVDLSRSARAIADDLKAADPTLRVEFRCQAGLRVWGDAGLLGSLLGNLLSNAWKFSSKAPAPRVEFGVLEQGNEKVYFVKDNGVGFDPALGGKLFKPFSRLHHQSDYPGHGIGLATCQRIVARHGGRLWAESQVGNGSTFYFTLSETL